LDTAPNYYDILGVRSTASADEIRRRYKFLVIAFHPDRFLRTPEHHTLAEQRIKQVNEAYRILSDPQARTQYDLARLATQSGAGTVASVQPYLLQLQQEVAHAQARAANLEQELSSWRTRLESALEEKAAVLNDQAAREQSYQQERQVLAAEVARLTQQLEQLARERVALDGQLKDQQRKANKKATQLAQELAHQERLVENLATTKAEWEKSNQSRHDLVTQQVRRLQEDVKQRDALLAQQRLVQRGLEERLANAEHEARLSVQSLSNALRKEQQEAEALAAGSERAATAHTHAQKSVRLWQLVALIAILNTLILLTLLLLR
jgi:curved DNA-binding protein CbpA